MNKWSTKPQPIKYTNAREPRPYVTYHGTRLYLDQFMRCDAPHSGDDPRGLAVHGAATISNTAAYIVHIYDDNETARVGLSY